MIARAFTNDYWRENETTITFTASTDVRAKQTGGWRVLYIFPMSRSKAWVCPSLHEDWGYLPDNWREIFPNPWLFVKVWSVLFVNVGDVYLYFRRSFGEKMRDKRRRGKFLTRCGE